MEGVDLKEFLSIISEQYIDHTTWISEPMIEAFRVFDKSENGFVDPPEVKRVFTKMGEHISDVEVEDQVLYCIVDEGERHDMIFKYYSNRIVLCLIM